MNTYCQELEGDVSETLDKVRRKFISAPWCGTSGTRPSGFGFSGILVRNQYHNSSPVPFTAILFRTQLVHILIMKLLRLSIRVSFL